MKSKKPAKAQGDPYNRLPSPLESDSVALDIATATWATAGQQPPEVLMHDIGITWQQQLTRVYEIGSSHSIYCAGPAAGSWQASRSICPVGVIVQFYKSFTRPVQGVQDVKLLPSADSRVTSPRTLIISGTEITGLGFQVVHQGLAMQEQMSGSFSRLSSDPTR